MQRAAIWISGAFRTSPLFCIEAIVFSIEAIAELILIYLYL